MRNQLITRPMKAPNDDQRIQSQYYVTPCYASPKIDGFRCVNEAGIGAVTSSMKPQPNPYVRKLVGDLPPGLDGEVIDVDFRQTMSTIKRGWGAPDFRFCVFDYVSRDLRTPAHDRIAELQTLQLPEWCIVLPQILVLTGEDLAAQVNYWAINGYQGIPLDGAMLRAMASPYKCNRATLNEGYLLKDKPYEDAEAKVLSIFEQEANHNQQFENHLGTSSRSSHQENKVGKATLGGLRCLVLNGKYKDSEILLGSGMGWTNEWRQAMYDDPSLIVSKIVTFKYLDKGGYDLPRNASMKCIREGWDS
jgi:DNA ligase-1